MANELDELTGPINSAGNSNSKIMNFFGSNGIKTASTAYGMVGSAAIKKSQVNVIVVAANNNEQVTPQEMSINKPLVKMIGVLASIDGIIKQRLENQKIISANERLARRESQVEQQNAGPQIEVIQSDAEKVGGSNVGLFALGGLALLALDPVQEALKTVFEGVASTGRFITDVVTSINDAFRFILGSEVPAGAEPANTQATQPAPPPATDAPPPPAAAVPAETPTPTPVQATPEEKPSFLGSIATGAVGGALVGSFIPKVGAVGGAIVGGVYGAYKYATGGSTSTPTGTSGVSSDATGFSSSSSSPDAIGGAVTPVSPGAAGAADAAETQVGMRGSQVGGYLSQGGVALNPAQDQWCSAFVNSSLARAGIQGATNVANSFQRWGVQIDPSQVQRGDVVLQTRGKGPDQVGGHVGIATGRIVDGKVEMIAGNSGRGSGPASRTVKKYFVPINQNLQIRRNDPNAPGITAAPVTTSETNSVVGAISEAATGGLKMVGELLGMLGSAIIKPGIPRTDIAGTISRAATEMNAEIATAKTPKEPKVPTPPTPPNINRGATGATQNPATAADKTVVYYYLRRFGYQDLNTPEKALPRAVIA